MKQFTRNETIALMYEDKASALRSIADYIEKWELDYKESVELIREIANQQEAQSMVVTLRDTLNP